MSEKPLVLIVCTGNSCRSQMAEAFLRRAAGKTIEVASAGSQPSGYVHPLAIEAMAEVGIELRAARSKSLEEFRTRDIETLITVCENAGKACHAFPGHARHYHWEFRDPAPAQGSDAERLEVFREVRDEIAQTFTAYGRGRLDGAKNADLEEPCATTD